MNYHDDVKAFVDGELEPGCAAEVTAAMATDADLREEIDAMRALGFELKRTAVEHPAKGADKAMDTFRRRPFFARILVPLMASACLVIAALGAIPLFSQDRAAAKQSVMSEIAPSLNTRAGKGVAGESDNGLVNGVKDTNGDGEAPIFGPVEMAPPGGNITGGLSYGDRQRRTISEGGVVDKPSVSDSAKTLHPDLIRTASMSVKVESAKASLERAIALSKQMGGFYESSHHAKGEDHNATAEVTLRVPVNMFDNTLKSLREFGEVIDENSDSQDVTAQIADVGARLKVLRAEEESYVTMLRAGRKIGEILEIKDRLSTVRQEIESLTAQIKALKNQSSYSTIACSFQERPRVKSEEPPKDWSDDAWANAVNGLKSVGRSLGQAAIFAFVYAPVWVPIAFLTWFMVRRSRIV